MKIRNSFLKIKKNIIIPREADIRQKGIHVYSFMRMLIEKPKERASVIIINIL